MNWLQLLQLKAGCDVVCHQSHPTFPGISSIHLARPLFNRTVHRLAHRPSLTSIQFNRTAHRGFALPAYLPRFLPACRPRLVACTSAPIPAPRHRQYSSRDKTPTITKATSTIISEKNTCTPSLGEWTTSACASQAEQQVLSAGTSETRTPCVVVGYLPWLRFTPDGTTLPEAHWLGRSHRPEANPSLFPSASFSSQKCIHKY